MGRSEAAPVQEDDFFSWKDIDKAQEYSSIRKPQSKPKTYHSKQKKVTNKTGQKRLGSPLKQGEEEPMKEEEGNQVCQNCCKSYAQGQKWTACSSCEWWLCECCFMARVNQEKHAQHEAGHKKDRRKRQKTGAGECAEK